jgi:hypothetical protein
MNTFGVARFNSRSMRLFCCNVAIMEERNCPMEDTFTTIFLKQRFICVKFKELPEQYAWLMEH